MKSRILSHAAVLAMLSPAALLLAQEPAPGSIHGHVQNAAGMAQTTGDIKLTQDRTQEDKNRKYAYSFPVDSNGDFKGTGIKPGKYIFFYVVKGTTVDYVEEVDIKSGVDLAQNDDMTREAFVKNMTSEQKKQIEDFKKANAAAVAANKAVGNMNAMLTSAREQEKAGKYDEAVATMQQATAAGPTEPILWFEQGNAQVGAKKYDDAVVSLQKAVELNAASKKPNASIAGGAYNALGEAYAKSKKPKEATDAYDKAAQAEPAKAATYYYNEAVVLYNNNAHTESAAAADKAIAADPAKADSYYLKGQSLIDKATINPKTQKMEVPPGCMEAYVKYLELAPQGAHAADVQGILGAMDEKQVSGFKASQKKK